MVAELMLQELGPQSFHLLLPARLNGGEAVLLVVDTGASRSVVDCQLVAGAAVRPAAEAIEAYGIGMASVQVQMAEGVELSLCDGQWTRRVDLAVADLADLRGLYRDACGLDIAGLLGCDFLLNHCIGINISRRSLTLRRSTGRRAKIIGKK